MTPHFIFNSICHVLHSYVPGRLGGGLARAVVGGVSALAVLVRTPPTGLPVARRYEACRRRLRVVLLCTLE